jgi:hypothetical protein
MPRRLAGNYPGVEAIWQHKSLSLIEGRSDPGHPGHQLRYLVRWHLSARRGVTNVLHSADQGAETSMVIESDYSTSTVTGRLLDQSTPAWTVCFPRSTSTSAWSADHDSGGPLHHPIIPRESTHIHRSLPRMCPPVPVIAAFEPALGARAIQP